MASQSNSDLWIGAASSENSIPTNPALKPSWKAPTSSKNTTILDLKDNAGTPNFKFPALECKEVLEQEWYTPESSPLMELPSYSSPYAITRSGFGLLDSSLNFDSASNLISSFRSAPSTLTMDDLPCTDQRSSVRLLSSIYPGPFSPSARPMDSFTSGIPTLTFNQRTTNQSGSPSNINNNEGPRNELLPHHKRTESSSLQEQQPFFHKRSASQRTTTRARKSPPRAATTSASNDSSVGTSEKGSPHLQNASGRVDLHSGSEDPNILNTGLDRDDYNMKDDDDPDESGDGSGGPYEMEEEGTGNGEEDNHGKGAKGKRGLPAKNLMAERRRRKKLNDRLYMLRSVVPKITKMDRASILADAIEYLKELLQRINDIQKELEAAKLEQSMSMPTSPTPWPTQGYPAAVKEECPVLPNPESQHPRVEVRKREGQALNIHMFCARRPGLLLNTVRALDALGLDVQQAVISCFNGFALDLFRAEAKNADIGPEEIKTVLLLTAGCEMHSLQ